MKYTKNKKSSGNAKTFASIEFILHFAEKRKPFLVKMPLFFLLLNVYIERALLIVFS